MQFADGVKLCECGCGKPTKIAKSTNKTYGDIKGQARRFVKGHNSVRPLAGRFWEKVNKEGPVMRQELGPCWEWIGSKAPRGYGSISNGTKPVRATHAAIFLETGKWPILYVCHRCDNPPCVRYSHLFENTQRVNLQDARDKGLRFVKLTKEEAKAIREEYAEGILTQTEIGAKYGVTYATVSDISRGKTWTDIEEKSI